MRNMRTLSQVRMHWKSSAFMSRSSRPRSSAFSLVDGSDSPSAPASGSGAPWSPGSPGSPAQPDGPTSAAETSSPSETSARREEAFIDIEILVRDDPRYEAAPDHCV